MSARDSYGEGKADVATAYRMRAEIDRLRAENERLRAENERLREMVPGSWDKCRDDLEHQLDAERTVRKQLAASRDAMVATVSFLASVIRCGEPMTPEVKQAIKNYYTRWDTLLAASNALDKETTR